MAYLIQNYLKLTLLMVSMPLILLLNGCVAVVAIGGIAGKEILSSKKSSEVDPTYTETKTPSQQIEILEIPKSSSTLLVDKETNNSKDNEELKLTSSTKKNETQIANRELYKLPSNQLELLFSSPWNILDSNYSYNVLNFNSNGNLNGFGGCNYFTGKFKANSEGDFLVKKLKSSNKDCQTAIKKDEAKIFNMLIQAEKFQIKNEILNLISNNKIIAEMERDKNINTKQVVERSNQLKRNKKK